MEKRNMDIILTQEIILWEFRMKKMLLMAAIGLTLTGFVSAQQGWGPHRGRAPGYPSPPVTVTGSLQLRNGVIAVENDGQVYSWRGFNTPPFRAFQKGY
jgi:hypothetical protein